MGARQCYLAMIRAYPGGWEAMAAALGLTKDALENRIYERKGQSLTVHQAEQMQKFSGTTHFAESVANESGGVFVLMPVFDGIADIELLDAYMALMEDDGKFASEFRDAFRDGKVVRAEFERLQEKMRRRQAHEMELMARIESMVADED